MPMRSLRRLPIGAEIIAEEGVHFRVWAPKASRVEAMMLSPRGGTAASDKPAAIELDNERNGYFSGLAAGAGAGALYRFRLDGRDAFPDPASRFQPEGPH